MPCQVVASCIGAASSYAILWSCSLCAFVPQYALSRPCRHPLTKSSNPTPPAQREDPTDCEGAIAAPGREQGVAHVGDIASRLRSCDWPSSRPGGPRWPGKVGDGLEPNTSCRSQRATACVSRCTRATAHTLLSGWAAAVGRGSRGNDEKVFVRERRTVISRQPAALKQVDGLGCIVSR